ncbi:MAG: cation:proton antiporter domain-containing protein [Betaproteobacteria bacterium]
MTDFAFLPETAAGWARLPWYVVLLLVAALAGEAAERWLRVPRLIGWIAAGAALGPHAAGALSQADLRALRPALEMAAGVVLFQLGQRVDPAWLGRNPWLLATSVLEAGGAFAAVLAVLLALGAPALTAAAAAAIAMSTAPAVVLTLSRELRAQGQVTERMLLLTALNSIYAFVAVQVLLVWAAAERAAGWSAIVQPLYIVLGSALLAGAFAAGTLALLRLLGRRDEAQFVSVLALVVLAVWAAEALGLSLVLALLGFGALSRLFDRRRTFLSLPFGRIGTVLLILLFAITAAGLDLALVPAGAAAAVALIAARAAGKALGIFLLAAPSGLTLRKASLLAVALTPLSAVAVILVQETIGRYPAFDAALATVVVAAVAMLELLGPLATRFALAQAGEADPERR